MHYVFRGHLAFKKGVFVLEQPQMYTMAAYGQLMGSMQPIYPLTKGLSNKTVAKAVWQALEKYNTNLEKEFIPPEIRIYSPGDDWHLRNFFCLYYLLEI